MVAVPRQVGAAGVVIWGGGGDQGTKALCEEFRPYFWNVLGPAVQRALATRHNVAERLVLASY